MKRLVHLLLIPAAILSLLLTGDLKGEERIVVPTESDGVQRIEILGGSYFFRPDHLVVKVNVPVELKIRKESGMTPHNFVLRAPEAGMDIKVELDKEPKSVRFTPTKAGSYSFYCDHKLLVFKNHRERGMEGTLDVQE
jgi:plastocyanin